jgi:hypothetical protein
MCNERPQIRHEDKLQGVYRRPPWKLRGLLPGVLPSPRTLSLAFLQARHWTMAWYQAWIRKLICKFHERCWLCSSLADGETPGFDVVIDDCRIGPTITILGFVHVI